MNNNIGKVFDATKMTGGDRLMDVKILPDGKLERTYRYGECRFVFQIEPATSVVLGWRFEGNDHDCAIVP